MLQFGMPAGFQEALDRKYNIMAQEAASRAKAADADANLTNVRAGLLPVESAANVGLTKAQIGLTGANTKSVEENTKFIKPLAEASIFNTKAQGALFGQQAVGESQLNKLSPTLAAKPQTGGLPQFGADFDERLKSILKEGLGYQ